MKFHNNFATRFLLKAFSVYRSRIKHLPRGHEHGKRHLREGRFTKHSLLHHQSPVSHGITPVAVQSTTVTNIFDSWALKTSSTLPQRLPGAFHFQALLQALWITMLDCKNETSIVTGKSLDSPENGNVDEMSEKYRKNVRKLSGGAANTIFRHFLDISCLFGRCCCW